MTSARLPRLCGILVSLFLVACSPVEQAYVAEAAKTPAVEKETFRTADDAVLFSQSWLPSKTPKAIIVALHGMNDYSHAFEGLRSYFRKHGVAVFAYDQRGFGHSPHTGVWGGEQNLVRDLAQYVTALKKRYPRQPLFILGESMGGAVAIAAAADPQFPKVQGLILSAPAVWGADTIPLVYRGTLWLVAHTIPGKVFTGSDLKIIASNNYPMLRAMSMDPMVIKGTRADAVYGVVHLMDSAYEKVPRVTTRVLLLYGANDQVIPPQPINLALSRFTAPLVYAYYPKGFHMLLRDLQAEVVMRDIESWINKPGLHLPSGNGKRKVYHSGDHP